MSDEFVWDTNSGLNIYAIRWQPDGDVFLSNGASDEVYGAGGNDADNYDVTMTEAGASSGHYVGHFDAGAAIAEGFYPYTFYIRQGVSPTDSDRPIAKGVLYWTGTAAINLSNITANILLGVVEGTVTLEQAMRLMLSALTGKASGGGGVTITFRDISDTKDRIVATVDADGNRTAISTRDGT